LRHDARWRNEISRLRAGECFLERDLDVVAQVAAALRTVAARRTPARALLPEEHVEDVAEALGRKSAEARRLIAGVAETIVIRALLRVGEHFVGFVDFLEVILGRRFIGRDVGMILARELAIGFLDVSFGRRSRHAENFVIVGRHRLSNFYVVEIRSERLRGAGSERHQAPIRHAARPEDRE